MKKYFFAVFTAGFLGANAQFSLSSGDMPNTNDTVRISYGNLSFGVPVVDTNYFWDYSALSPTSQYVLKFEPPSNTSYFGLNTTLVSSYAVYNWSPDSIPFIPVLPNNFYDFYKESSSSYRQVGQGYSLFGFPVPVFYNPSDKVYEFPGNHGDIDTADAQFVSQLPSIFYWKEDIHRVNHFEGWGTLITPLDTFPSTIQIRTELSTTDSISLDTFGISIPSFTQENVLYQWFAPGSKIPVLTITASLIGGNETVTQIMYQDKIQPVIQIGMGEKDLLADFNVFPNPSTDVLNVSVNARNPQNARLRIYDLTGRSVFSEQMNLSQGQNTKTISTQALKLAKGTYILSLFGSKSFLAKKIIID